MTTKILNLLRKDAERYRFLRSEESRNHKFNSQRCIYVGISDWAKNLNPDAPLNFWSLMHVHGKNMDKELDKLITKNRKQA